MRFFLTGVGYLELTAFGDLFKFNNIILMDKTFFSSEIQVVVNSDDLSLLFFFALIFNLFIRLEPLLFKNLFLELKYLL